LVALAFPLAAFCDLYRFVDDQGVENYTTDPKHIPAQYRSQITRIQKRSVNSSHLGIYLADRYAEPTRKNWIVLDLADRAIRVRMSAIIFHTALESLLFFWPAVLLFLTLAAAVLLGKYRERSIYHHRGLMVSLILAVYLAAAVLIVAVFFIPAYKDFLAITRDHLVLVRTYAVPDFGAVMEIERWDSRIESWQLKAH